MFSDRIGVAVTRRNLGRVWRMQRVDDCSCNLSRNTAHVCGRVPAPSAVACGSATLLRYASQVAVTRIVTECHGSGHPRVQKIIQSRPHFTPVNLRYSRVTYHNIGTVFAQHPQVPVRHCPQPCPRIGQQRLRRHSCRRLRFWRSRSLCPPSSPCSRSG